MTDLSICDSDGKRRCVNRKSPRSGAYPENFPKKGAAPREDFV